MKTGLLALLMAAPLLGQGYIAIEYPPGLVRDSCSGDTCEVEGSKAGFCTTNDGSFVTKPKIAVAMVAGVVNCTEGYAYYGINVSGFAYLPDGSQGYDSITGVAGAGQGGISKGNAIATDSCNAPYVGSGRFVNNCINLTCGDGLSTQDDCPPPPCDPTDPTGNCFCDPTNPDSSCYVPPCDTNNLTDYSCHIPCTEGDCPPDGPPIYCPDSGCGPNNPPYPPCDPNDPTCAPPTPTPCDLDPTLCGPPCDPNDASCNPPPSCDPTDPNSYCYVPPCDDATCNPPYPPACDPNDPTCNPPWYPPPYCDPNDPACTG